MKPFTLKWWLKMQDHYWAFAIAHLSNFNHTGDLKFDDYYRKSISTAQWINKRIIKNYCCLDECKCRKKNESTNKRGL